MSPSTEEVLHGFDISIVYTYEEWLNKIALGLGAKKDVADNNMHDLINFETKIFGVSRLWCPSITRIHR